MTKAAATEGSAQIYSILFRADFAAGSNGGCWRKLGKEGGALPLRATFVRFLI